MSALLSVGLIAGSFAAIVAPTQAAVAAQSPSQVWLTGVAGSTANGGTARGTFQSGLGMTLTASGNGAGAPQAYQSAFTDGLQNGYWSPDPPAVAGFTQQVLNGQTWTDQIIFDKPVIAPRVHFLNIDGSSARMYQAVSGGQGITTTRISGNNVFNVDGNGVVNASRRQSNKDGCQANDGSNPSGACGTVQLTGGPIKAFNMYNEGAFTGDGWRWTLSYPTAPLTKQFSPSVIEPGETSQLTFTIANPANDGQSTLTPLDFTDNLPSGVTLANTNTSNNGQCGSPTYSGLSNGGSTVQAGNITVNAGATCQITVNVTASTPGTYVNNNSNLSTSVANLIPNANTSLRVAPRSYTVSKSASTAVAHEGEKVQYTVTVKNTGQQDYTDAIPASFSDDLSKVLDDATYNGDASDGATVSGNTLNWSGPIAVGQTRTITYSVTVNKPDTGDKILTNSVTPTGHNGTCDQADGCTTTTPVQSYTVEKTADQTKVEPGNKITYTVTVVNTGKVDYTDSDPASFTDDLSNVTDDATYNGDATNGATVSGNTLSWSGPLAQGETKTITYSFTVNSPDTGDKKLQNAVTPTSPGGGCAKEPCGVETPIGTYAIKKTVDKDVAKPGDTVTWTVSVENTGTADVDNASFTDDLSKVLDDATYNKDAQASSGTVSYDQPTLSWNGTVPVGQTITITYSATVNNPDKGDASLDNVITSPYGCKESGAICETDTPVQKFDVKKTADVTGAQQGDTVTYTVTVTNTGKVDYTDTDPATFDDDMSKVLDDATYNNDAVASAGTVSYARPKLSWSGPLAVGQTETVTYSVKVNTPDTGDKSLDNVVVSPGCYPNDPDCDLTVPVGSYTVAKTADKAAVKPGQVVHYTVTVTNTSKYAYTTAKPASFTDDLSQVTDDATYNGDASNGATVQGNKLSWAGALGVGQTVTVTYSFTVNNPDTGDKKLVNVVDPGNGGGCATAGGCTTNTNVTPNPPAGPAVATGGTALMGLGVWPMVGAAGASIMVLLALLAMTLINRRRNGDSA